MKKFSIFFIFFYFIFNIEGNGAETLTLNCSFEKYVDQTNLLDEKIIPKNQLSTLITDDKFITLEIKSNNDIKILDNSFMIWIKPKIIIPYKIDDNFIHFKEKENSLDKYSLDRRTGSLLLNYKSSKEKLRIYYLCVKKDKLF
jgi:hypothetical protein